MKSSVTDADRRTAPRLTRGAPAHGTVSPDASSAPPPLKWAGGKRWQVKHLLPFWLGHARRRLVEPFCGGLAVALGLGPKRALLNDINPHLIAFYRWLKRGLRIDLPMENNETLYYVHRRRFNEILEADLDEAREAAELFYFLNRTGYNGLCRFNRRGRFNVPFGRYDSISYRRDFMPYRRLFTDWQFASLDFEKIALRKDDFVYADPPYDVEFTQYAKEGFTWDDQIRLVEWLSPHRGPVILSNQATERIERLYQTAGYRLVPLRAPRRISCTGDRTPAREVLALRNL
jgi:DNA adenine methylase